MCNVSHFDECVCKMHKHLNNNNNSTFHLHNMTTILSFYLYTEFRVFQNQDGYDFKVTKRRGMKICDVRFCVCVAIEITKLLQAWRVQQWWKTMSHTLTGEEHISSALSSVWYTLTEGHSFNPCGCTWVRSVQCQEVSKTLTPSNC